MRGRSQAGVRASPGPHLSADRICVHQRFQAWRWTDSMRWAPKGSWAWATWPSPAPCPSPSLSPTAPGCLALTHASPLAYPGIHGLMVLLGLFEELLEAA